MKRKCKFCESTNFDKIIDLGKQPFSGFFPDIKSKDPPSSSLEIVRCDSCKLIQLKDSTYIASDYYLSFGYNSSLSNLMKQHLKNNASKLIKYSKKKRKLSVLDVGGNDSTFLGGFNNDCFKLGVDPTANRFIKLYKKNKANLISDFFTFKKVNAEYPNKKFDIIASYAMFYCLEDPLSFSKDISKLLNKNGIWNLELSYWPLLIQNMTWDQICHEHITYFDLTTLKKILFKAKIKILDVSFNEINGGSFNIICAKNNSTLNPNKKLINQILDSEKKFYDKKPLINFSNRVKNSGTVMKEFLEILKSNKKTVIGYGASTKGNILLNYSNINNRLIKYICDENPIKINKRVTPGSRIKIISKQKMRRMKCDYLFVLIWSFRKEVIKQEISFIKKGGKIILPLPILHIIDKNNYKDYLYRNLSDFAFKL